MAIPVVASGVPPTGVFTSWAVGSLICASVPTFTGTVTSSVVPSGYVTTTVPSLWPGVVVSTGSFQATVVPFGNSSKLAIPVVASGVPPTGVFTSWAVGSLICASVPTFTGTVTSSVVPSGYVTTTVPSL